MDLELVRVDYALIGHSAPHCMKLLPPVQWGEQQKVATADADGVLQLSSVRKEEIEVVFKTLPGPKITSLQLGGVQGTPTDKLFVSSGNEVKGYTKKGKMFLGFDTNLTEPIQSMYVFGSDLLVCGNHVFGHYKDCKDAGSYLCGDTIVDVVAVNHDKFNRLTVILACSGRVLRILEHCRVIHTHETSSVPTTLHLFHGDSHDIAGHVLYGMADGSLGLLTVERKISGRMIIDTTGSAITCIDTYDMTGSGISDLILGRQDGTIQVFNVNLSDEDSHLVEIYNFCCHESISSLVGGIVGARGYTEVLVCTYTGRLFGLTTQTVDRNAADSVQGGYVFNPDTSQKITRLKVDIEELEQKVTKEREKYQASTQSESTGLSAIPMLDINDMLILCKEDASYILSIEAPTPLDIVLLQSDVPADLLDVQNNTAVVSMSHCEPGSGNYLLATYRCQVNTNRLEVKFRTIEGQHGTLTAYVTPLIQPKCCQVRKYPIKPLSLHMRTQNYDENRPYNILYLKGTFSQAEMHSWVSYCLPEVPERASGPVDRLQYCFISTFTGTMVNCTYSKGEAEFKSDNISTISILKDVITKEATKKKIRLEISCTVNEASIPHTLTLLDESLRTQMELCRNVALLDALDELDIRDETELLALSSEFQMLLKQEKEIREKAKKQPATLDRLYGIITDLYIDRYKFKGMNVKTKISQLLEVLEKYDLHSLIQFFENQAKNEHEITYEK